jgi:hypothetical protein
MKRELDVEGHKGKDDISDAFGYVIACLVSCQMGMRSGEWKCED